MYNIGTEDSPFSVAHHVGVIVEDMDKSIKYYESLGIGPFGTLWPETGEATVARGTYRGKSFSGKVIRKAAQMGPIMLELLQPIEGESIVKEYLNKNGEGINHIGFVVDDMEKARDKLVAKGFKVIFQMAYHQGGGCVFLDTDRNGGILLELCQPPPAKRK